MNTYAKTLYKLLANTTQQYMNRIHNQAELIPEMPDVKLTYLSYLITGQKSVSEDKRIDKIQQLFMIKMFSKLITEGNSFNMIKDSYEKSIANITFDGEILCAFPRGLGTRMSNL